MAMYNASLTDIGVKDIEDGLVNKGLAEEVSEDDKVLVVVDGEIKKTNVDNIGVRELVAKAYEWEAMNGISGVGATRYLRGVAYGDGKFVCVGEDGNSYYSTDGVTWVAMTGLDTSKHYYGVTYGDGKYVCVGATGSSYYSTDGLTWTAMTGLDTSKNYQGVTYGNDRFVCVGNSGLSYYSTDGLTWQAMSGLNAAHYQGVTYGNGRYVCVGTTGSSYYSTDGLTWTAMTGLDTSTIYRGVAYGDGKFVCVGAGGSSYYNKFESETLFATLQVAGTLLFGTLFTGSTTVTITDQSITQDSTFDIYTDKYGVNPKNVTVNTGSITLEFKAQEVDVNVKVVCR